MDPLHDNAPSAGRAPMRRYDFRSPDKFSKDQLNTLRAIHDTFARSLSSGLTRALRQLSVQITLSNVSQMTYSAYVESVRGQGQLALMTSPELDGPILLNIDYNFLFAAIERMGGGLGLMPKDGRVRPPTAIEESLIQELIRNELRKPFEEAWQHIGPARLSEDPKAWEFSSSPLMLRVASPSEVVAVLTFEVRAQGQLAPITIVYPHTALEPLLDKLSVSLWSTGRASARTNDAWAGQIDSALDRAPISIQAVLAVFSLSVDELARLAPGDYIRLDGRPDQPILLSVSGATQALGLPGQSGGHYAVRLLSPFTPVEE